MYWSRDGLLALRVRANGHSCQINRKHIMKKIIGGKIYNTETALCIGYVQSDCGPSDFRYEDTGLFRTKKGSFFIAGEGGPLSRWSQSCNNGQRGGASIEAMTTSEALAWCESSGIDADVIAQYFSVVEA